jgi:hypothetical protein
VRLLYLATVLGLLNLGSLGLPAVSVAQAAGGGGYPFAAPVKRPLFRPWSYSPDQSSALARAGERGATGTTRLRDTASRRPNSLGAAQRSLDAMIFDRRAGARKAVPITRGQELGLRFRPDDRASPYAQPGTAASQPASPYGAAQQELQSQFRPLAARRKPTYEELQAETAPGRPQMPAPVMPYPAFPAPLPPGPGGTWPAW